MPARFPIPLPGCILLALLTACDNSGATRRADEQARVEAKEAESRRRVNILAELLTEQQFLELKLKAASEKLERQGNKTRKRLQPRLAALGDTLSGLGKGVDRLKAYADPGFTSEAGSLRTRQDSLASALQILEKAMK